MTTDKFLKNLILDVSMRLPCGGAYLDFRNDDHLCLIETVLEKQGLNREQINGVIGKLIEKNEETNNLSDSDISMLKTLGLKLKSDSEYRTLKINDVDIESVTFNTGGGSRVFQEEFIPYNKLYSYIKNQALIYITVAGTRNKMRSADNIKICAWGPSRGPEMANYEQIIAIFKLTKQFPKIIKILNREPTGINYEMQKVEELNGILSKSATPYFLYIYKDKKVVPMHVSVKTASKIIGVGKADIALENELKKEVFWISYKYGDYFGKQGQILLSVPFQQYGSLQGLYDEGFSNKPLTDSRDVSGKDIQKFINEFIKRVLIKSGLNKYGIKNVIKVDVKGKNILFYTQPNNVITIGPNHPIYDLVSDPVVLKKTAKNVKKEQKLNLYFFIQGTSEYYFDMMAETELLDRETLDTIAGKSIYGSDFYVGNNKFGRENINILLQTSHKLVVQQHKTGDDVDGLILKTDEQGHILINPNLPSIVTEELGRVIDVYLPVLFARFTRNESFKWEDETGGNMILGGRFLILPKGKMPSKAIEIKM